MWKVKPLLLIGVAAGALSVPPAASGYWAPQNAQRSSSASLTPATSAGPIFSGDIGGGYTFKGPMSGPFSIYNKNGELVGTTENQRANVITNDPDLQKVYSDNQRRNGGQIVPLSMHMESVNAAPNPLAGLLPPKKSEPPAFIASNGWGVTLRDASKKVTLITLTPPPSGNAVRDALAYPIELAFTKGSVAAASLGALAGLSSKTSDFRGDVITTRSGENSMLRGKAGFNLNNMRPQVEAIEEAVDHGHGTRNFDKDALKRFEKAGQYQPEEESPKALEK